MNPEGKITPNTSSSPDQRAKKRIEERDRTKPSQTTTGKTQPTTSGQTQTPLQQQLAALKSQEKLNELKQKHPHLFPQNQTPKPPSASSGPSPS